MSRSFLRWCLLSTSADYAGKQLKVMAVWSNTLKSSHSLIEHPEIFWDMEWLNKKSRNGDTLGPVKLNVWPEHPNQVEKHEQDDQGDIFIIIFGMSKSSGFQKCSICWVFQALFLCLCLCHCLCLCTCVLLLFLNSFHHKLSEYVWL